MTIKQMKMQQSIVDDEFWTKTEDFQRLCNIYSIFPKLDAAANDINKKCPWWLDNAMFQEWIILNKTGGYDIVDVWCNPPHSMTEDFIRRADSQHKKYGMNIMMIVPSNTESTKVWSELIEGNYKDIVENHRIEGRPRFLKHGFKKTKFSSRNAYRVIIWRKKN